MWTVDVTKILLRYSSLVQNFNTFFIDSDIGNQNEFFSYFGISIRIVGSDEIFRSYVLVFISFINQIKEPQCQNTLYFWYFHYMDRCSHFWFGGNRYYVVRRYLFWESNDKLIVTFAGFDIYAIESSRCGVFTVTLETLKLFRKKN